MAVRLFSHFGRTNVLPPRELVDALVERTDHHWYWLGEFYDDRLDRTAIFPWSPPAENQMQFVVARLLWCWQNDGVGIKRLHLENTCGLATCINPAHWRYISSLVSGVYHLPEGTGARLVKYGKTEGTVHIVREDTTYTVCGASLMNLNSTDDPNITCKTCVSEWRSTGSPALIEVKPP